ncbi:hypothetical protein [Vibrio sp. D431a]|uniref:hypothetical protein n=1 Tax=Vibrio sp. D431a TaxID=2837388 RepID=UPI002556DBAB|nr:hypothetical protein [Vibrio sp. D431a]MDK9790122.1 hypothetical protein [Vibrio sp. D431a]
MEISTDTKGIANHLVRKALNMEHFKVDDFNLIEPFKEKLCRVIESSLVLSDGLITASKKELTNAPLTAFGALLAQMAEGELVSDRELYIMAVLKCITSSFNETQVKSILEDLDASGVAYFDLEKYYEDFDSFQHENLLEHIVVNLAGLAKGDSVTITYYELIALLLKTSSRAEPEVPCPLFASGLISN